MRALPIGTVTLLFTDIEGSTRMLQELGREAYVRALTAPRRLLRAAFAAHGGVEVEMQGDSFHFAFPFARDAVTAAVVGQQALQAYEWGTRPIRVRIGLHTGEPVLTDGLYAGLDVHHAARVMSAAHGGQVLVSARTAELVAGELPHGITLLDLGEHGLKDFVAPERLHQATGEGLQDTFPPLRSLSRKSSLPAQPTPLVGRQTELAQLRALLADGSTRLVTVTGPGKPERRGLRSKPRGSCRASWRVASSGFRWPRWPAATSSSALSPAPWGSATSGESLEVTLRVFCAPRRLLLLLDDFEHLLDARAVFAEILAACPEVTLLVTSRVVFAFRRTRLRGPSAA